MEAPDETIVHMIQGLRNKRPFPVTEEDIKSMLDDGNPDYQQVGILLGLLRERDQEILQQLDSLMELLNHLRVLMKYQTFDLEATRRERDAWMKAFQEGGHA